MKPDDPIPEDVHWEWVEVIKAAQAACKSNGGYAQMTITVSVHRNKPVLWASPELVDLSHLLPPGYKLLKLSPKRVADFQFTGETAAVLMAMHEDS